MITKLKEMSLGQKIIFTSIILVLVHFFSQIPLYGINRELLSNWLSDSSLAGLSVFRLFSGSSLANLSIFALGVSPYISASIIIQLLRVALPALDSRCKEAKSERDFVERITMYVGVVFAIIQSLPLVYYIKSMGLLMDGYFYLVWFSIFIGSLLVMFLGKVIDKFGLGKGISLILLLNIMSSFKSDLLVVYGNFIENKPISNSLIAVFVTLVVILVSLLIVIYLQEGKKDYQVMNSANMSKGRMGSNSSRSNLSIKLNMGGVMPIIFAMTILQILPMITSVMKLEDGSTLLEISKYFNQGYWFNFTDIKYTLGVLIYFVLIFFFSYFYMNITFNTREISENLSKQGTTLMGIRPGKSTQAFLDNQIKSIILVSSLFLIIVSIIPWVLGGALNVRFSLGGTSLIIIVSVLVETYKAYISEREFSRPRASREGLF